jgi:hypothetical protein
VVLVEGVILGEGGAEVANILESSNGEFVQLEMGGLESRSGSD